MSFSTAKRKAPPMARSWAARAPGHSPLDNRLPTLIFSKPRRVIRMAVASGLTSRLDDLDGGLEVLAFSRRALDSFYHVHSLDDTAKGCEPLTVRIALAAKIQFGLVSNADKEIGGCGIRPT